MNEGEKDSDGEPDVAGVQVPMNLEVLHTLRHKRCHYDSRVINDSPKNCVL